MSPEEKAERERLSRTPGLTRAQIQAVLDPEFPVRNAKILLDALRARAAAAFEQRPESEKAMARAFGQTEHVVTTSTSTFDPASGVQTFGSKLLEVPRG